MADFISFVTHGLLLEKHLRNVQFSILVWTMSSIVHTKMFIIVNLSAIISTSFPCCNIVQSVQSNNLLSFSQSSWDHAQI